MIKFGIKDTNWRTLLEYCTENNAYIGCELPDLRESLAGSPGGDDDVIIDDVTSSAKLPLGGDVFSSDVTGKRNRQEISGNREDA